MPRLILLGAPGSGKGTLAARAAQVYGIPAISTGDALREEVGAGSQIGLTAKSYMDSGKLVPDEIILELVGILFEKYDVSNGFLFDGFPRTIAQAEALDVFLAGKGMPLETVLFLNTPKDLIVNRIANRRVCPACEAVFNVEGKAPGAEEVCDRCGAELVRRKDDDPATVEKRIEVYNEQTRPLIDYYINKGILAEIDGTLEVEDKQKQIVLVLGEA